MSKVEVAVISNVHLLPQIQEELIRFTGQKLTFPDEDKQPDLNELVRRTGEAEAILISPGTKITKPYLDACPSVKYIGICGTSKENVDIEEIKTRNIIVTNIEDYGDEPASEFIFMQLQYLARGMGAYQWRDEPAELMGKTIGIIGLGSLGKEVARLALAYKMNVLYYSPTRKPEQESKGVRYAEKDELLRKSEILVICSPTNTEVIGSEEFSLINPNTIIVQASMGDCMEHRAFLEWIKKDKNFAIFDYSAGHENYLRYKDLPQVIFPKIYAGHTYETKQRLGKKVILNLKSYLEGQ